MLKWTYGWRWTRRVRGYLTFLVLRLVRREVHTSIDGAGCATVVHSIAKSHSARVQLSGLIDSSFRR